MIIHKVNSNLDIFKTNREKINKNEKKIDSAKNKKLETKNVVLTNKAKLLQKTESILRNALDNLHELDDLRNDKLSEVKSHIDDNFINSEFVRNKTIENLIESNPDILEHPKTSDFFKKNLVKLKYGFQDSEYTDSEKLIEIKEKIKNNFYSNTSVKSETINSLLKNLDF